MMQKILLIEPDAGICEAIMIILEDEGYQATARLAHDEMLLAAFNEQPALIIVNILEGSYKIFRLIHEFKNSSAVGKTPLLLAGTGIKDHKNAELWHDMEFIEYPFEINSFTEKVRQLIPKDH